MRVVGPVLVRDQATHLCRLSNGWLATARVNGMVVTDVDPSPLAALASVYEGAARLVEDMPGTWRTVQAIADGHGPLLLRVARLLDITSSEAIGRALDTLG